MKEVTANVRAMKRKAFMYQLMLAYLGAKEPEVLAKMKEESYRLFPKLVNNGEKINSVVSESLKRIGGK